MIRSMTGFGRAEHSVPPWRCRVEIRSVNGRFLETRVRMPSGTGHCEEAIKALVKSRCSRGKFECSIQLAADDSSLDPLSLNLPLARSYAKLLAQFREVLGQEVSVTLRDLIETKDLIQSATWEEQPEQVEAIVRDTVSNALEGLVAMRESEGASILTDLGERVSELRRLLAEAEPIVRDYPAQLAQRLRDNLARYSEAGLPDDERIRQEIAILADRSDVTEEITRFSTHLSGLDQMLEAGGPIGRKFEFVLQELNREANTLAAKCNHPRIGALIIDVKAELEKLREQIQNIE